MFYEKGKSQLGLDMKKIEYMAQFVNAEFTGVISGVTAFGLFVELDNGVEGLVHVSSMANDYYEYAENQYALIGQRTNKVYRIGDQVTVILMRADIKERIIDFILKDDTQELYFLEVNTIPGQSEQSIVPQQVRKMGLTTKILYSKMLEEIL